MRTVPFSCRWDSGQVGYIYICKNFLDQAFGLVKDNLEQAGHDFWLTRNRHGAGFWDDGWPEDAEKTLTDLAHSFGEKWYHLDENGFIES